MMWKENPNKGIKVICWCCAILALSLIVIKYTPPHSEAGGSPPLSSNAPSASLITFEDLLDAIEWVESRGDANAVGDGREAIGAFQIWKIYVDDLNQIYKAKHTDKYSHPMHWDYCHRRDKVCSRIMVRDYLGYYATEERLGHDPTFEDMARIHNGGPDGWKNESTKAYWQKVKARLDK